MVVRHRLATDEQGRAVVVKRATLPGDVERLAREAVLLRAAAHPGVVSVVGAEVVGDGFELELAVAGTRTAADLRVEVVGVAGFVAALATTVADLHGLGIVHGRIRADHVVVDRVGRPVLCGFGGAGRIGEVPPRSATALTPPDDVAALGALLAALLDRASGVSSRRGGARHRRRVAAQRSLQALAAQASAPDPTRRPTARAVAASILANVPDAHLPESIAEDPGDQPVGRVGEPASSDAPPADRARRPAAGWTEADGPGADRGRGPDVDAADIGRSDVGMGSSAGLEGRRRRSTPATGAGRRRGSAVPVAAAVGVGLLGFGVVSLVRPTSEPALAPVPSATEVGGSAATTSTPATAVVGTAVVVRDGVRYGVGRADDRWAIGDWDCDGVATVAVLRPGSGAVYVFDGWAVVGRDVVAGRATTVAGAVGISGEPSAEGCPTLVVVDQAGGRTEVPT